MVDAESTQSNDALAGAPAAPISDWSNVRGFQVLAAAGPEPDASVGEPNGRTELEKELAARAARFAQSVDDSIVLASDGVIRWLGDPVARLIAGEDLLRPKAVLLADEALPAESREAVQTRLALWLTAHVSKVLGPLEALAEPGAVAEPVRALGSRIAQALGVLERERVRQQVKTLDQSARSALRKLGVRFGSMYIFVPALLKPGARTLCSQLWGLRRGEAGAERLLTFAAAGRTSFAAEAPLAADTYRVAGFRLCGDRVVRIDIVERLNDLIRAAIPDHMRPGGPPASEASGFLVSPQMTSLTGCAGESFASILRSLGYESHRVKRSEFEAANRKPIASMNPIEAPTIAPAGTAEAGHPDASALDATAETTPESEGADISTLAAEGDLAEPIEAVEAPAVSETAPVEAIETRAVQPDDGATPAFADVGRAETSAVSESAPVEAVETQSVQPDDDGETPVFADVERAETSAVSETASVEAIETPTDEPDDDGETPVFADVERAETSAVSETASVEAIETPAVEPDDSGEPPAFEDVGRGAATAVPETALLEATATPVVEDVDLAEAPAVADSATVDALETPPVATAETPTVEVGEAGAEPPPPAEDEWVEVWRPAPRRRPQPAQRPSAPYGEREAATPRQARDPRRRWPRDAAPRSEASVQDAVRVETPASVTAETSFPAAIEGSREAARPEGGTPSRQERGPRRPHKGPRTEPARGSEPGRGAKETQNSPVRKEPRPQPVDMDSPFAKLLALKPLLERRDKRT